QDPKAEPGSATHCDARQFASESKAYAAPGGGARSVSGAALCQPIACSRCPRGLLPAACEIIELPRARVRDEYVAEVSCLAPEQVVSVDGVTRLQMRSIRTARKHEYAHHVLA